MKINEINPSMLILEYRQESKDKDYGSCLWARFYFNLERYELLVVSDCGSCGYKWVEGTKESFIELMIRCEKGYMLTKLFGEPKCFNYDKTKEFAYSMFNDNTETTKSLLDNIFERIEEDYEPESGDDFCTKFDQLADGYFDSGNIWQLAQYEYSGNENKIVSVFEASIKPKLKEYLV